MKEAGQIKVREVETMKIWVSATQQVSGLLQRADAPDACYVLAHGAGAGMRHPFLADVCSGLIEHHVVTLRYQFPYMEKGSKRTDTPAVAQETVRAAVKAAGCSLAQVPLFAGGKSFGGRMTSQAQAELPLPGVRGLIFLGFPLHLPGQPSDKRGEHLLKIDIPMLFLQGDRDEFARLDLLQGVVDKLGPRATLKLFANANHSFHVPARLGRKDTQVMAEVLSAMKGWMEQVLRGGATRS